MGTTKKGLRTEKLSASPTPKPSNSRQLGDSKSPQPKPTSHNKPTKKGK